MRIAVNTIFLQQDHLEGYGNYINEIIRRLAAQHSEHEFIFLFDRPFDEKFITSPNIKAVIVSPPARHAISFFYWYNVKAPWALRSYRPDVWIQPCGFCSLSTRVPQLLVMHDLSFIHHPSFISWHQRLYYRWFTPRFLRKAAGIVTVSEFSKKDIVRHFKVPPEKITVIYGAAKNIFQPVNWQQREVIKEKYADGKEYFLFVGGIHPRKNIMNLLKAFSLFKKWQHSNMKLLIAGRPAWQYDDTIGKLKTYKYRDDVTLLGYVSDEDLTGIMASAYALTYTSFFEGFGLPILEAMQCEVPVITSSSSSMPEVAGDAALLADPDDPDTIAKEMLSVYKDEILRSRLIAAGKERVARFNWDDTATAFWQQVVDASRQK